MRPLFSALLLLTLPGSGLIAQVVGGADETLWTTPVGSGGDGGLLASDFNGDGFLDLAIVNTAYLNAIDGRTGSPLWSSFSFDYDAIEVGPDFDGDGILEVMVFEVASTVSSHKTIGKLLSGRTGDLLRRVVIQTLPFMGHVHSCAAAGDLDQDGWIDFRYAIDETVYTWSLGTNTILHSETFSFYPSIFPLGDLDGDSLPEYGVRARGGSGPVLIHAGANQQLLRTHDPLSLGHSIEGVPSPTPDLDGDGIEDYLLCGSSHVLGISGAAGTVLWTFQPASGQPPVGRNTTAHVDMNADGVADVLASHGPIATTGGAVAGLSGANGEMLWHAEGREHGYGEGMVSLSDLNQDGVAEFAASYYYNGGPYKVEARSFLPCLFGGAPAVSSSAGGQVALELHFPSDQAGLSYRVLASAAGTGPFQPGRVAIPLTPDALFRLTVRGAVSEISNAVGQLDGLARASSALDLVPGGGAAFVGRTISFAAVSHGSNSLRSASVAVSVRIEV